MEAPHRCDICKKPVMFNIIEKDNKYYHKQCFDGNSDKTSSIDLDKQKIFTYQKTKTLTIKEKYSDAYFGKSLLTEVIRPYLQFKYSIKKNKYLELVPQISLYFEDLDEKKAKEFIKNGGLEKIKTEIKGLLGDDASIIVGNIVFGSILAKIYVFYKEVKNFGKKAINKIENLFKSKKEEAKLASQAVECLKNHSFQCIEGLKPSAIKFVNQKNIENSEENEQAIKEFLSKNFDSTYDTRSTLSAETKISDLTLEENITEDNLNNIFNSIKTIAENEEIELTKEIENIKINENFNEQLKINLENYFKESIFEFRINGLVSINNEGQRQIYQQEKNNCPNCESRILFHATEIEFSSKILTTKFKVGKDNWFGLGIYFSDQLDYVSFYYKRALGQILEINKSFSVVVSEVYYDKEKFKQIYNSHEYALELDSSPTEEEINSIYKNKTVPKNSIHFIEVDSGTFKAIDQNGKVYGQEVPKERYIGREFCVTSKEQIYPIYGLNIQRVDFCVIWRDSNFNNSSLWEVPLKKNKRLIQEMTGYNLYTESDIKTALKLVWRKRYNKIILITNVGSNLEGKKFVDKVRKILQFDVMVLFFTNNFEHLTWIKDYPNSLFCADDFTIKYYVFNFNEEGFREIRNNIRDFYGVEIPEPVNPFLYPLFDKYKNGGDYYQEIDCNEFTDFD